MDSKYAKPIPRAVAKDVIMEDDSVLEESVIADHQEVMKGYETNRSCRLHVEWSRYTAAVLPVLK